MHTPTHRHFIKPSIHTYAGAGFDDLHGTHGAERREVGAAAHRAWGGRASRGRASGASGSPRPCVGVSGRRTVGATLAADRGGGAPDSGRASGSALVGARPAAAWRGS
jgi:hypothetical protein